MFVLRSVVRAGRASTNSYPTRQFRLQHPSTTARYLTQQRSFTAQSFETAPSESFLAKLQSTVTRNQSGKSPLVIALNEAHDTRIRKAAAELAADYSGVFKIETSVPDLNECNRLLKNKEIDGVVSGADTSTGDVLRSAIRNLGLKEGCKTVSSFFLMDLSETLGRQLIFADCAVVPDPKPEQLADIAGSAAEAAEALLEQT